MSSAVGPATVDGTGQCPAQAPAFTGPQSLANGTVVTNKWLDYNYLGDILTKSDVGTYRYTKVHKIASIALNTGASLNGDPTSPVTLGYDGNGNVTSGPNRTIAYTSYNLPSTIVSNGKTQTWLYDDQHRRFQRSDASSVRYYWDGGMPMEWDTGAGTLKHYVTFQGMNVGEFTATLTGANWASQTDETVYFQTDALGSTVAMTSGMTGGGATEADAYDAWGKFRYPTGADDPADQLGATPPNRRYFTGEEYLANSGLTHLNGRLYDPAIGTMLSVDPVTRPYDPQDLNPYGYVGNNPVNYIDPTGMEDIPTGEVIVTGTPNSSQVTFAIALSPFGNIVGFVPGDSSIYVHSLSLRMLAVNKAVVINGQAYTIKTIANVGAIPGSDDLGFGTFDPFGASSYNPFGGTLYAAPLGPGPRSLVGLFTSYPMNP